MYTTAPKTIDRMAPLVSIPDTAKAVCGQLCSIKYNFCEKAQHLKALLLDCGALTDEDTYEQVLPSSILFLF